VTQIDHGAVRAALKPYQSPSRRRSVWEILATAVPFAVLWGADYLCLQRGWWWGIALSLPAAVFLVRLFLIQHDCGHHAFFRSAAANNWVGRVIGVLTMTPYEYWRRTHAIHHATSGNLDRRTLGGIETLTTAEYRALRPLGRLGYRLYRHPLVMLGVGPAYMFLFQHRVPIGLMRERWAWLSAVGTNLALLAVAGVLLALGGPTALLLTHVPIVVLAATIGVWLFYVQHQFEGGYWARNEDWSPTEAALKGSSHLVLPAPLRWLSANIGAHHVHHAASKVPFYRVPEVLRGERLFRETPRVGLRESFTCLRLSLWDEAAGRLVSFRDAKQRA
jgi:omega-6 fatty acid desaturase (delta-12 desaturase)